MRPCACTCWCWRQSTLTLACQPQARDVLAAGVTACCPPPQEPLAPPQEVFLFVHGLGQTAVAAARMFGQMQVRVPRLLLLGTMKRHVPCGVSVCFPAPPLSQHTGGGLPPAGPAGAARPHCPAAVLLACWRGHGLPCSPLHGRRGGHHQRLTGLVDAAAGGAGGDARPRGQPQHVRRAAARVWCLAPHRRASPTDRGAAAAACGCSQGTDAAWDWHHCPWALPPDFVCLIPLLRHAGVHVWCWAPSR